MAHILSTSGAGAVGTCPWVHINWVSVPSLWMWTVRRWLSISVLKLHHLIWRDHRHFGSIFHNRTKDISKSFTPLLGGGWICCLPHGPCWTMRHPAWVTFTTVVPSITSPTRPPGVRVSAGHLFANTAFLFSSCCCLLPRLGFHQVTA